MVSEYLALVGDTSDNVPGMPGVGKVTASKLLNTYGSIDGLLERRMELKGKMKERFCDEDLIAQLQLSRKLVRLCDEVPLPIDLNAMVPAQNKEELFAEVLKEFEFFGLLERMSGQPPKAEIEKNKGGKAAAPLSTLEAKEP